MKIEQYKNHADPIGRYTIELVLLVGLFVVPAVMHVLAVAPA